MKLEEFKFFYPERPVLVNIDQPLFEKLSDDPSWIAEMKLNGCRLQLHYTGSRFEFWNRHGTRMDYRPDQEMAKELDRLAKYLGHGYYLFDGELRHGKVKGVQHKIMLYDVFVWNSMMLLTVPFSERHGILEGLPFSHKKRLLPDSWPITIAWQYQSEFGHLFKKVTTDPEIEGLVLKNIHGVLDLGRTCAKDSRWMFKVRRPNNSYRF